MVGARPWWHGGVVYQVYVRSFADSDGDGFGDLAGLAGRLDHLAWLGVDGIWLSPTMPSPDRDWGYDVADYRAVHPQLGTLAQLDALVAAAAERGIRVLLDLVPNHTSEAHPWFVDAASSRTAEHRTYYVWADAAPGGGPPTNWRDATGESAWSWHEPTGQYYLHNFLPSQPDLNWWDPRVRAEFADILRFWWDRGIAGFRIDVAHALYHDAQLRDNPDGPARAGSARRQAQLYNVNRPETHEVYRDWRRRAAGYTPERLLLGETFVLDLSQLAGFYGAGDELQLGFNFPFALARFAPAALGGVVADTLALLPPGAAPVWMGSNHDIGRFATRWAGGDERRVRLALTLLLTLPGTTVLYYGDEIAMADVDVPADAQRDPMSWHGRAPYNRDRARTPMRWTAGPGAGFTAGTPWLPVGTGPDVAAQRADADSVLALARRLIRLRHEALRGDDGLAWLLLGLDEAHWAYRCGPLVVVANFTDRPIGAARYAAGRPVLCSAGDGEGGDPLSVPPWSAQVWSAPGPAAPPAQ